LKIKVLRRTVTTNENWIDVGTLNWFYRDAKPNNSMSERPPVLFLHGLPSQSYGWVPVLDAVAAEGFWAIAPDWLGFGFSAKPDKRDFAYTPDAYVAALEQFITTLDIPKPFHLVVQGFVGTAGLQLALQKPEWIDRLVILNAPILPTAKVPWKIQQLGLPLIGDMLTQDPLLVDRTLEGGAVYRVEDADLDVYRRPFLKSSDAGRSLLAAVRNLKVLEVATALQTGYQSWEKPVLLAWGVDDPWLPITLAETFAASLKSAEVVRLEQVGHYPQQDWHEKVSEAILHFFRRQVS
jgi:pimeloyl-ACP methyl ester carboxylesterase